MASWVHTSADIACILSALSMANRLPTIGPDTRESRLYHAGFQAGLQMVAEALGIEMPLAGANQPTPILLDISDCQKLARRGHISS